MRIGGDAANAADGRRLCLCQLGGVIERALPWIACQFGKAAGFCLGGFQPSARKRQIQPTASTENLGQYPGSHGQSVPGADPSRSEEHTSELQSRFDLVCRLLLESA